MIMMKSFLKIAFKVAIALALMPFIVLSLLSVLMLYLNYGIMGVGIFLLMVGIPIVFVIHKVRKMRTFFLACLS